MQGPQSRTLRNTILKWNYQARSGEKLYQRLSIWTLFLLYGSEAVIYNGEYGAKLRLKLKLKEN